MAYSVTKNGESISSSVIEIIADTNADIESLPTNVGAGSSCLVLNTGAVYILGNDKVWHEV